MGLLPNVIEAQKSLMSKSKSNYEALKRYMDKLTQYMELIDVAWEDDAGEKYFIFKELNAAGKAIAEIASGYKTYTVNVNNVLNLLKEFLEFAGIKYANGYTFTPAKNKKSSKTRVRINTKVLRDLGIKIFKLGQSIEEIELDYKSLAAKVDDQVDSLLRGKITSLSTLNRKLDKQALSVMKAGTAIVQICNNYEAAEKNIKKKAADIISGKQVVFGDGKASNVQVGNYEGGSYNLPSMTTYSLIGNISNNILNASGEKNILDSIKARDGKLPRNNGVQKNSGYVQLCTMLVRDKLALVTGVERDCIGYTNGRGYYKYIKDNFNKIMSKKNSKCVAESISGTNALKTLIQNHEGEVLTNVVVSYSRGNEWGHSLLIDKIEDGKVYFSDNFNAKVHNKNNPKEPYVISTAATCMSVDDFIKAYSNINYKMVGVNYIHTKE